MNYRQPTNPKRQKLLPDDHGHQAPEEGPRIDDIDDLRERMQEAIGIEHFTIPPYLCALYSIQEGANLEAANIIRSVVVEEMLHMVMAANLLNAIGGEPKINARDLLPTYPREMPHSTVGFEVNLLKFSKEAVNTFLRIERPAEGKNDPKKDEFPSIGEFYKAVCEALNRLDAEAKAAGQEKGIFTGKPELQVTAEQYYGSGGKLIHVRSLDDAHQVIDEIVGQGEGVHGSIGDGDPHLFDGDVELAHYFRFNEIFLECRYKHGDRSEDGPSGPPLRVDWDAVYNMKPNPKMSDFKGDARLHERVVECNQVYMKLLGMIHRACNGEREILKTEAMPLMYDLKYRAIGLMTTPSGIGNYTAGPTFEYVS